jgi:DNA modification methylase
VSDLERWTNDINQGDAAERLAEMPAASVHCVMTSPPYFGLRDYGVDGQIGLDDSLDEYIADLLDVASELRRVLREDGSWWLNLGDTFAGSWGAQSKSDEANQRDRDAYPGKNPARSGTLRRKSKMLVPHRVAIALEDAGWIVRADCPWVKPNPMPHPVKDRLHEHKEFIFHLTPEPDYWFDLDAVREPHQESSVQRASRSYFEASGTDADAYPTRESDEYIGTEPEDALHPNGKNPGDVFEVSVKPFPEAHFAVYPPELCETPIKASCPPTVCAECGTPYERQTADVPVWERDRSTIEREQLRKALDRFEESDLSVDHLEAARAKGFSDAAAGKQQIGAGRNTDEVDRLAAEAKRVLGGYFREITMTAHETVGWSQACDCASDATEAGIVLDPFAGAGTTCLVAKRLGRRFVGIDLNPEYVAMAQRRVGVDVDEPERLLEDGETSLLAFSDGGDER